MNETRHMREASDSLELGLPCKDSAARIKRTLTVVPNAASDLHTPVPGRTFRGDETIVIDNLTCRLWLINVCASYRGIGRARRSLWGHENVTVFDLVWVLPINHLLIRAYGNILCVDYSHVLWWAAAAELMIWLFFFFYRGWFEVHIRPFPAWEENIPEEPQHQKSKERRHFGSVAFISFHCHSCNQSKRNVYYLVFLLSSSSCLFFCVMLVCLCRTQIEVIHDYQESRSCVSYSLEGEDSPDLLKRWGGGSRPHICPSSVLLLMLFTLWFSLFGGNDALWLSLCLFPWCAIVMWWGNS